MESLITFKKSAASTVSTLIVIPLFYLFVGCQSKPISPEEQAKETPLPMVSTAPKEETPTDWSKAITKTGKNEKPSFSSDGKRLLFISRDRNSHKHRQLYEMNLENKEERRITYQDGEVFEGILSPDDQSIFYTSTTDEIKERPILFYPELKSEPFPTTEIYRIKPKDDLHERWTSRPGFDGFIHTHTEPGKGLAVTQSRWVGSDLQMYRSYGQRPGFEDVGAKKSGQWNHSFTTHLKKPWKAWVQENSITGATTLLFQKSGGSRQTFDLPTFEVRDLQFVESNSSLADPEMVEFIYTGRTEKMGARKAFWLNITAKCQAPFLKSQSEVSGLQVSPDGKSLAWTLSQANQSQIFMGLIDRGSDTCEPLPDKDSKSVASQ